MRTLFQKCHSFGFLQCQLFPQSKIFMWTCKIAICLSVNKPRLPHSEVLYCLSALPNAAWSLSFDSFKILMIQFIVYLWFFFSLTSEDLGFTLKHIIMSYSPWLIFYLQKVSLSDDEEAETDWGVLFLCLTLNRRQCLKDKVPCDWPWSLTSMWKNAISVVIYHK